MPANDRKTTLGLAAMLILLAAGGAFLHYRAITSSQQRLATVMSDAAKLHADNEHARQLSSQLSQLEREVARISARIPTESNLGAVLESLSNQLAQLKVSAQEILTQPTVVSKDFSRVPVSIKFRGSSEQSYAVLKHLKDLPYVARIGRLTIDQPGDGGPPEVSIEFSVFHRAAQESVTWTGNK
jgi:Tfp pilus assembly protein PilO